MKEAERTIHDLGFKGIVLDTEQYGDVHLFTYPALKSANRYTFDEYSDQVFERGQQVMAALNRGYPGLTVLYTFGLTIGIQPIAFADLPNHPRRS